MGAGQINLEYNFFHEEEGFLQISTFLLNAHSSVSINLQNSGSLWRQPYVWFSESNLFKGSLVLNLNLRIKVTSPSLSS